jgi:hypothetical protein
LKLFAKINPHRYHGLCVEVTEMKDLYHNCRYCKWYDFKSGMCGNDKVFGTANDIDFHPFYENGYLADAIREGFNELNLKSLKYALEDSRLSKKRIAEILKIITDELDDAVVNWTERIDDSVSIALNNFDFSKDDGVKIVNPTEFYCNHYL